MKKFIEILFIYLLLPIYLMAQNVDSLILKDTSNVFRYDSLNKSLNFSWGRYLASLFFVFFLILLFYLILKKLKVINVNKNFKSDNIEILENYVLDNNSSIIVVRIYNKVFILGKSQEITKLHVFEDKEALEIIASYNDESLNAQLQGFSAMVNKYLEQFKASKKSKDEIK